MNSLRRFPATAIACLLANTPASARPEVLGVVVEAHRAHLNASEVSAGTTVYDGDQFLTEEGGALRLRSGAAMVELAEKSHVLVGSGGNATRGTEAKLIAGTAAFSSTRVTAMEIHALEARIRSEADGPTVGEVTILGPKELRVRARRGKLEIAYRGETEIIEEGKAFRVVLDPPQDDAKKEQPAKKAGRRKKAFLLIGLGVAGGVAGAIIYHELQSESPDRP